MNQAHKPYIYYCILFLLGLILSYPGNLSGHSDKSDFQIKETVDYSSSATDSSVRDSEITILLTKENKLLKTVIFYGAAVIVLMLTSIIFVVRHLHKRQMEACRQLNTNHLKTEKAEARLHINQQELTDKALSLARSEELIKQLKSDIQKLLPDADDKTSNGLTSVMNLLKSNENSKQLWQEFDYRFNELNDDFINNLTRTHPDLSPSEIRISAMLRMQLSTKEISEITRRSVRTVECTRSNIRKKIGLKPSDNLTKYLMTI